MVAEKLRRANGPKRTTTTNKENEMTREAIDKLIGAACGAIYAAALLLFPRATVVLSTVAGLVWMALEERR